jgi:hypothetical protein
MAIAIPDRFSAGDRTAERPIWAAVGPAHFAQYLRMPRCDILDK